MSRSDRTDPLKVRIWYATDRTAYHDHELASCDLPRTLAEFLNVDDSRCTWHVAAVPRGVCFCLQRHEWWHTKTERRVRRATNVELDAARRLANSGDDLPDEIGTTWQRC